VKQHVLSAEKEGTAAAAALVRCAYGAVTGGGFRNLLINMDGQKYPFVSFLEGVYGSTPLLHSEMERIVHATLRVNGLLYT
jgi:hypothetical protein